VLERKTGELFWWNYGKVEARRYKATLDKFLRRKHAFFSFLTEHFFEIIEI
jgi:hypothetical protein